MARRAPTRIWGALLGEQGRLLALTGTGLAVVISFAAAVKPLADGQIGLGEAMQLMGLAMVPMLQFSLPFAAGFAATMTYHRFAAEREATAAMAGGVGHRSLIAPAVGLGVVLTVVLAVLLNVVIPGFLRSMERIVAENASRMISSTVERGESIHLGPWDVHAGGVTSLTPSAGSGAFDGLLLTDVFAVQRGGGGDVEAYVSAKRVAVWMFGASAAGDEGDGEDSISVQLVFNDADLVQQGEDGTAPSFMLKKERIQTRAIRVPGTFSEDPKFMSYRALVALRDHPERIPKVQTLRTGLAARMAEHQMIERIDARLRTEGVAELIDEAAGLRVAVVGSALARERDGWRMRRSEGAEHVRIVRTDGGGTETVHLARDVFVDVDGSNGAGWLTEKRHARLVVRAERVVTVRSDGRGADAERRVITVRGLRTPTDHLATLMGYPVEELQRRGKEIALDAGEDHGGSITKARRRLKDRVADLNREITSKQHERAAFSLTGLLMVLTGAVVGFKMKDSLALPVYMWSFFPALFAVITIGAGQSMAHKSGEIGLFVLWGGVVVLGVFTLTEYGKLRKH